MKKLSFILIAFVFAGMSAFSQYTEFINPIIAPLHFNSAFAGSLDQHRMALTFHNQFVSIPGSHKTLYASYDQLSNRLKGGIGGEVFWKSNGSSYDELRASGIYAPKFNLGSNWTLSPALKVGYHLRRSPGYYISYLPPQTGPSTIYYSRHGLDFSPAILINSPAFYFGVSSEFLGSVLLDATEPTAIISNRPTRNWKFQAGYLLQPEGRPGSLAITGMVISSKPVTDLLGQVIYTRNWLLVGSGFKYSYQDSLYKRHSVSLSAGYKHRLFRCMAVYEYAISGLTNDISGGSFDLSLMFYLPRKKVTSSPESSSIQ